MSLQSCCTPWQPGFPSVPVPSPWDPRPIIPWHPRPCIPAPVTGYAEGVAAGTLAERERIRQRLRQAGIPDGTIDMVLGGGYIPPGCRPQQGLDDVISSARRAARR